jgi:hypothetical protein
MTFRACGRENELRELVMRGQWPEGCADELRAHVEGCRSCGELVLVMTAFRAAKADAVSAANPGSAGVLWWRAQLRRRKAAMESIGKPILGAQFFAWAVTLAIAAGLVLFEMRQADSWRLFSWRAWLKQLGESSAMHLEDLWSSAMALPQWSLIVLALGLAAVALLSGAVLFSDRQRQ